MWYFDPSYLLFMLPGLVLSLLAQWYVSSTFRRLARVPGQKPLGCCVVTRAAFSGADCFHHLPRKQAS